ncbi:MAG: acyl-CoA carboxylase subunit beta [Phycisphaeraceae bacterium]|nr:acyl-CoA carboxylase subunit beta [Phycisphaerales bacterium]MCB9860466.1 acyl-CoA carboxylase subunit beta [Phycisphaeraceae bacterium]
MNQTQPQTVQSPLAQAVAEVVATEDIIRQGGGAKAVERQHAKNRLTARERVGKLIDADTSFTELGLWSAFGMYKEHGGAPAAGVVTGVGEIDGHQCMIIANDATVKAGAFFPMTCKKIIRAQHIARNARLPLVYLVDSAGVFLPMQEDVFPDADDFGRIFYLNSVISAEGIPQIAAIMGYCVAGGGYLPVLCDNLIMTEGSGLYLAGPALVKAAIGQDVTDEELGGATMHAQISGTIDYKEPDDDHAIDRVRALVGKLSPYQVAGTQRSWAQPEQSEAETELADEFAKRMKERMLRAAETDSKELVVEEQPFRDPSDVYDIFTDKPGTQYDVKDIISCLVDARAVRNDEGFKSLAPDFDEYKEDYGRSLVCGYARIDGHVCGIVANQGKLTERVMPGGKAGPSKSTNMPRVIYDDSADKAARFIMDCNQKRVPIVFLHDTNGFMVGRDSEQGGIIRAGAKLVNAVSNCVVPKIVVVLGGSYGAGHYAMCGRAFEPFVTLAWPGAKYAVMGANQATGTLAMIEERSRERAGEKIDEDVHKQILAAVHASYTEQQDIRYAAARGWVDRIIKPEDTRRELGVALDMTTHWDWSKQFCTGVLQV